MYLLFLRGLFIFSCWLDDMQLCLTVCRLVFMCFYLLIILILLFVTDAALCTFLIALYLC